MARKGSDGCPVVDKNSLDIFGAMADKTSKGPKATIVSPKTRPGDGLTPDVFRNRPRIGSWKVVN